jgi:hypothetical protein
LYCGKMACVAPAVTSISVSGFEFCHKSSGQKSYF